MAGKDDPQQPRGMQRPDKAPVAGHDEDGPQPFPRSGNYEGGLQVFQGEIDPHDYSTKSGTANLMIGDWRFSIPARPAGEWIGHDLSNSVSSDD